MLGEEYLEINPSVNPIIDNSSGIFIPKREATFMAVTANNSLTAKTASGDFVFNYCSIEYS